jgi:hypothetical protein
LCWKDSEQKEYFETHVAQVKDELISIIIKEKTRFPSYEKLLNRFNEAASLLKSNGLRNLDHFFEIHNEVCLAISILEDNSEPKCIQLDYELPFSNSNKLIDFKAQFSMGPPRWLEVKTIHPTSQDDWRRYEKDLSNHRFSDNTSFILQKEWMGGTLYHNAFAARSRILEYTIDFEKKISECLAEASITFLVLFSNGFHWHLDELEDFVHFYRHGSHFIGDHFGRMEQYYLETNNITLLRNIDHFSYIEKPDVSIRPKLGIYSIIPPIWPPKKGIDAY